MRPNIALELWSEGDVHSSQNGVETAIATRTTNIELESSI